jgi:hypothetical protein
MPDFDYLKIEPITGPIPPKKQEAKRHYGAHPYFTRRSFNVIQKYIERFTQPGDLVFDPFGGSGVTSIEALILGRKALHVDINPMANFITHCIAVSPIDKNRMNSEYLKIEKKFLPFKRKIEKLSEDELNEFTIDDWYPKDIPLPKNADREFLHELFTPTQLTHYGCT